MEKICQLIDNKILKMQDFAIIFIIILVGFASSTLIISGELLASFKTRKRNKTSDSDNLNELPKNIASIAWEGVITPISI